MGALFGSVLGKVLLGVSAVLLASSLFFLSQWQGAKADLEEARDATVKAEAEIARTVLALTAAEARADERARATQRQRDDEETIRDEPETFNCASSPALNRAFDVLRDRRESDPASASDPE